MLSKLLAEADDIPNAIEALRFVVEKNPGNQLALERLAHLHVRAQQLEKAEALFVDLHNQNPASEKLLTTLARFYLKYDKFAAAAKVLKNAETNGLTSPTLRELRTQADASR